ncbi:MAG: ribosomal L7Ae/L30e/S12e/Gadd45 family protein [Firmicutes bacterium]|nr:ribosomal L7Ae/L30e/S12e/Gadd45 family protein [Bacillota bacterium]
MDTKLLGDPGRRVVGAKQTVKALNKDQVQTVFVAEDADLRVTGPIIAKCKEKGVELVKVPTMSELGAACSIQVGAAVAAILKDS